MKSGVQGGGGNPARPAERLALGALVGFTLVAVAGYLAFGVNPGRIPDYPVLLRFYSISFNFFAQGHIWVCAIVLAVVLAGRAGFGWIPALGAVYFLSFISEFVGTGYGLPFGEYSYSHLLGPKLGDRVPVVIPLSWFLMAVPSYVLARQTFGRRNAWLPRILFASLILTIWDLALDPAMSYLTPRYWLWDDTGPYYGMPWINLGGWYVTGLVIFGALELTGAMRWSQDLPVRWMAGYYGAVLLMPVGMLAATGLWLAIGVTAGALVAAFGIHRLSAAAPEEKKIPPRVPESAGREA